MRVDNELLNLFKLRGSDDLSVRDRDMVDVAIKKRVIYLGHKYITLQSNSKFFPSAKEHSTNKCDCNAKSSAHSVFCPAHPGNQV